MAKVSGSVEEVVHPLSFSTSQEAWEKLNEYFLKHHRKLFESGSSYTSGMSASFNIFVKIKKAWVDPDFDYGRMFNYKGQKWTTLVNNYLNLNKLDLLRSKVRYFQSKNNQNYNISYSFDNTHDNGKGCLLAATFSRRLNDDIPVITMVLRSSEITKRLIFDLLLIQRMGEYVYGEHQTFMINIYAIQMYCNTETLVLYHGHKDIRELLEGKNTSWTKNVLITLNKFLNEPTTFGSYKVFLRTAKSLSPEAFKNQGHVVTHLYAKDLKLEYDDIEYPDDCITLSQRKKFKQKFINKNKRNEDLQ